MQKKASAVLGLLLVAVLSGCAITVNDGDGSYRSDWRERQEYNRATISRLEIGMTRAEVEDRLGPPDLSEAFDSEDGQVRVLYYRTQHERGDGKTTRDETTPLVFRNDHLEGWGETVLRQFGGGG